MKTPAQLDAMERLAFETDLRGEALQVEFAKREAVPAKTVWKILDLAPGFLVLHEMREWRLGGYVPFNTLLTVEDVRRLMDKDEYKDSLPTEFGGRVAVTWLIAQMHNLERVRRAWTVSVA